MPIEWGEEARIKTRQRQRRLHMLAVEGRESAAAARAGGEGEGAFVKDSRSMSRVPWLLLDELDAEKQKLMASTRCDPKPARSLVYEAMYGTSVSSFFCC